MTGSFVPLKFVKRDGKVFVRGLVDGVVHHKNGDRSTFAQLKTVRVKSINGTPARSGSARATCDILHLVLGPLDLDLLGLKVHLDRVVLDIVAVSGAGNLLGNLLCAVTGLLDGGLGGALGRVVRLLNRILASAQAGLRRAGWPTHGESATRSSGPVDRQLAQLGPVGPGNVV